MLCDKSTSKTFSKPDGTPKNISQQVANEFQRASLQQRACRECNDLAEVAPGIKDYTV